MVHVTVPPHSHRSGSWTLGQTSTRGPSSHLWSSPTDKDWLGSARLFCKKRNVKVNNHDLKNHILPYLTWQGVCSCSWLGCEEAWPARKTTWAAPQTAAFWGQQFHTFVNLFVGLQKIPTLCNRAHSPLAHGCWSQRHNGGSPQRQPLQLLSWSCQNKEMFIRMMLGTEVTLRPFDRVLVVGFCTGLQQQLAHFWFSFKCEIYICVCSIDLYRDN